MFVISRKLVCRPHIRIRLVTQSSNFKLTILNNQSPTPSTEFPLTKSEIIIGRDESTSDLAISSVRDKKLHWCMKHRSPNRERRSFDPLLRFPASGCRPLSVTNLYYRRLARPRRS